MEFDMRAEVCSNLDPFTDTPLIEGPRFPFQRTKEQRNERADEGAGERSRTCAHGRSLAGRSRSGFVPESFSGGGRGGRE